MTAFALMAESSGERLRTAFGIARSLAIYHGVPGRARRLRRFYGQFLQPGDLAFDIGAHVGDRSLAWARLGARVVAVEPQASCAGFLRWLFRDRPAVAVLRQAVGAVPGSARLRISAANPTVSSLSDGWIETVAATPAFAGIAWARSEMVAVTTLDALIAHYGVPRFCKIDIEGFEDAALAGLSRPLPLLSIEYLAAAKPVALAALDHLQRLGRYHFNVARGETMRLAFEHWVDSASLRRWLGTEPSGSGDIYARWEEAR